MLQHEFLASRELKEYQQQLLIVLADLVSSLMNEKDYAEAQGARQAAKRLLELPIKLYPNSEALKERAKEVERDFRAQFIKVK